MHSQNQEPQPRQRPDHPPAELAARAERDDPADDATETSTQEAAEHFVRGVVTRGEAAVPVDGELPPGATHEIVEQKPGELPKIKRKRFSMF